jgi:hypothetical protein
VEWVIRGAIAFVVIMYVLAPLVTLAHELGHALVALLVGSRQVVVLQGREPPLINAAVGRLELRLRPLVSLRTAWYGRARWEAEGVGRAGRVAASAAGPRTSFVLAYLSGSVARATSGTVSFVAYAATYTVFGQFLATAIPMRYGRLFGPYAGDPSDGLRILRTLRGRS